MSLRNSLGKSSKYLLEMLAVVSGLVFFLKLNTFYQTTDPEVKFNQILIPYIQLIPRHTLFNPWVIVTSVFAEVSLFSFILSGLVIFTSTKYVEKFWGYKEVIKFVLIIGSITNLLTVLITIVVNIFRQNVGGMDKPLGGGISYYFGFLVVLKQLIPEHNIILFQGLINFRVKQFPFILIMASLFLSVVLASLYPFLPSINSFFVSYIYLRFFQTFASDPLLPIIRMDGESSSSEGFMNGSGSGGLVTGDASDTFQLVEFFPNFSKPLLAVVFDRVYELSVFLGVVTPFNDEIIEQSNARVRKREEQTNQAMKGVANSVAERRRQVALQVIEERISKEKGAKGGD